MSGADYDRWDQVVRTFADLTYVAQASSAMLGQMVREDPFRTGLPLDEVGANIRRAIPIAAGG